MLRCAVPCWFVLLRPAVKAGRAPWFPTRYLPFALVTASAVLRALSVPVVAKDFPFVAVGAYASWLYLRFFAHL